MIKDFIILNCIGKNDKIGLKFGSKFYIHDFDQKVNKNDQLVLSILKLIKKFVLREEILQAKFLLKTQNMIWHFILNVILLLQAIEGGSI